MRKLQVVLGVFILGLCTPAQAEPLVGLTAGGNIVHFDSATPGTIARVLPVTGLSGGEALLGLDRRPDTGELFAVSSTANLYVVEANTGAATLVAPISPAPTGTAIGMDFNPTVDRIRIVTEADDNRRVSPLTGAVLEDTALNYDTGDINQGANPEVVTVAYINNDFRSATTTLYGIDTALDVLVLLNTPNSGKLSTIGPLGVGVAGGAFEVSGNSGVAFAALSSSAGGPTSLFTINLSTGAATLVGGIGLELALVGLAADVGTVIAPSEPIVGLSDGDQLLHFDSANPGIPGAVITLAPLAPNEILVGIDARPVDGTLFAYSNQGNLYTVNPLTGAAYFIAASGVTTVATSFGFDFNPVVDRMRVVTDLGENFRVLPTPAPPLMDGVLLYGTGDVNELTAPRIGAVAYTNSVPGAVSTTLYSIDHSLNLLVLHTVPNSGTLATLGPLGVEVSADAGFDISGATGTAYLVCTGVQSPLYTVDLSTGGAALVGAIAGPALSDIAVLEPLRHTADGDADGVITLSELLRVIQFYNSLGLQCASLPTDTEDGYLPGPGASTACAPHNSDYAPQDWVISLTELLRVIQFYNSLAYYPCPGASEDGLCPGAP